MAERERVVYRLSDATKDVRAALIALGMTGEEYGALTPAMLEKGSWKSGSFRPYNIGVSPARTIPGRKNPYVEFLESVKDKLVSLGFEEFDGNMVETEFWNSDALFMPLFIPRRDIRVIHRRPRIRTIYREPHCPTSPAHETAEIREARGRSFSSTRFSPRTLWGARARYHRRGNCQRQKSRHNISVNRPVLPLSIRSMHHPFGFLPSERLVWATKNLRTCWDLEMFAEEVAGQGSQYVPAIFPYITLRGST